MGFEYTIKTYSMQSLRDKGVVVDSAKNIVFACRPDGACEIHDVGLEQIAELQGLLNEMGKDAWELVQLLFRPSGIVSFWKRALDRAK
jgi:hypothetical protein